MPSSENPAPVDITSENVAIGDVHDEDRPTPEELRSAQAALAALQTAVKTYPLYPQSHAISIKLIASTLDTITYHFDHYPSLKFTLGKECFEYRKEKLALPANQADLMGPPLRRDGVEWVEFEKDVHPHELSFFVEIINKYRNLADEPEGDLVTCLWKEELANIKYKASEILLETVPQFDFAQFKPKAGVQQQTLPTGGGAGSGPGAEAGEADSQGTAEAGGLSLGGDNDEKSILALTDDEREVLQQMVISEESWDNTYDVIDVLLIILQDQEDKDDFESFMKVIHTEFEDSLLRGDFKHSHLLLERLKKDRASFKYTDASAKISQFYHEIASLDTLEALAESLKDAGAVDKESALNLKRTLAMLPADVVEALASLLPQIDESGYQRAILEVIVFLSTKEFAPLERAVNEGDDSVLLKLIPCLGHIQGSKASSLLRRLTREKSVDVRKIALKVLLQRDGSSINTVFELIEDPRPEIRRILHQFMSRERDKNCEKRLLDYLRSKEFNLREQDHIHDCYRTLGRCGSPLCLSYLQESLMGKPYIDLFTWRGSLHRRGAALALHLIELPKAKKLLNDASKSIFPNIRNAAHAAVQRQRDSQ